ncbi:hypothetical protein D3C72_543300 [compost metagenome]
MHPGVTARPDDQIAAAQGADAHEAFQHRSVEVDAVVEAGGVVGDIAAEIDPPGGGHVLPQLGRQAVGDAIAALTPQPVADRTAADPLEARFTIGGVAGQPPLNRQGQVAAMLGIPGLIVLNGGGIAVEVGADPRIGEVTGPRQHGARLVVDVVAVQRLPADLGRGRARRIDAVERHLLVVAARQQIQRADAGADDAEVLHQLQAVQPDAGEAVRHRGLRVDVVTVRQGQITRMARAGQIGRRPQGAPVCRGDVRPGDKPHRPGLRARRQHGRHGPDPALRPVSLNRTGVVRATRAQKLKVHARRDQSPCVHRHVPVQRNVRGEDVHRRSSRNNRRRDAPRGSQDRRYDRARTPIGV